MRARRIVRRVLRLTGFDVVPYRPRDAPPDQFRAYAGLGIDPRIIVDVGANEGVTVERYLERYPDARVIAVEPLPELAARLTQRLAPYPNVVVVHVAVDERCGTRSFRQTAVTGNSSFFEVSAQQRGCVGHEHKTRVTATLDVPTTTLDRLAAEHGLEAIDILKLDIQGAELLALRGAELLLTRRRIAAVCCEVQFAPIYEGQCWFHEVAALLLRHGYWLYDLFDLNRQLDGSLTHGNALFLSPEVQRGRWE